jgi:hypothetical protein
MKSLLSSLFFLLVACANPNLTTTTDLQLSAVPQPLSEPTSQGAALAPQSDATMMANLDIATSYPCSLGPTFESDSSVAYVLKHIDEAHPLLLEMLRKREVHAYDRAFRILVIAGKPESVPVMEALLLDPDSFETTKASAGQYLGLHPAKEAFGVLLKALDSQDTRIVFGATLGLIEHKDKAACEPLRKELTRGDDSQQYYVIQAAGELGCLSKEELTTLSQKDQSNDIRGKAKELLQKQQRKF